MEIRKKQPLRQSIINRLQTGFNFNTELNQQYADIIKNVGTDLQNLLNTRSDPVRTKNNEDLEALDNSLFKYGIPDFSQFNPESDADRKKLKVIIEKLIAKFEPRLQRVTVEISKNSDPLDFRIRFHIDAILVVEPNTIPVHFTTEMQPAPTHFTVTEATYDAES
jgi:type VI secretion system protein ImpF